MVESVTAMRVRRRRARMAMGSSMRVMITWLERESKKMRIKRKT
jgi:hypothetical protein